MHRHHHHRMTRQGGIELTLFLGGLAVIMGITLLVITPYSLALLGIPLGVVVSRYRKRRQNMHDT